MKAVRMFLGILLVAGSAGMIASCGNEGSTETAAPAAGSSSRAIAVQASVVGTQKVELVVTHTGSLEGEQQADLYSKVAEAVERVNISAGATVASGDILIELDRSGPSSQYVQLRAQLDNAKKQYDRMKYLFEQGAVSEAEFDQARTEFQVAEASFDAASQLVHIRTPIGGVVTSVNVSPGDFVQVGTRLATVATVNKLRVLFGVDPGEISGYRSGTQVLVTAENSSDTATGTVVRVASSADPMTREFEIEALVDNSQGRLRPGMFVRVNTVQRTLDDVIVIPRKVIVTIEGKPVVFVARGEQAVRSEITLGPDVNGNVVVESGLAVGDTLITLGQNYLDDGYSVRITSVNEG